MLELYVFMYIINEEIHIHIFYKSKGGNHSKYNSTVSSKKKQWEITLGFYILIIITYSFKNHISLGLVARDFIKGYD